jgi:tRNA pseudouridine55 synthase
MEGIFAIYKEKGPTSNKVVQAIKRITGVAKVGHAGTLDPLAEGILVVAIGRRFTRDINKETAKEKEYLASVRFGTTSSTDDEEGEKTVREIRVQPSPATVEKAIKRFIGEVDQTPPIFSAIKINGREAYKAARRGENPEMSPRKVIIKKIEIISYRWPDLKIKVTTGPGVYIRSLARDLGEELGVGGYLSGLVRTRVGGFSIEDSLTIEEFKKLAENDKIKNKT